MKFSKYYPFAFIYFFINGVGLPIGLLYTTLLTPLFYVWILIKGKRWIIIKFLLVATPFIINHLINGFDASSYWISSLLFLSVYLFGYAFYTLISTYPAMERIFRNIAITNFILTVLAIFLLFSPYRYLFWFDWSYSFGVTIDNLPRLTMLTYEPSYYSTLLVPVFAFYFVKFILKQIPKNGFFSLLIVIIPLILSFSMGVISGLIIAIFLLFTVNFSWVLTSKKLFYSFSALTITLFLSLIVLLIFYRDNPFFIRAISFVTGHDVSGRARTSEAFQLAYVIAEAKSVWWGIGPGQIKIIGDTIIREFYKYQPEGGQVSIPNAFAETLALFGIVGASLRFFIVIYLFFKTRVLNNYFRTLLFFYIFIYQFTGSFTTNVAEYVIWILAFTNIFPQFDKDIGKKMNR